MKKDGRYRERKKILIQSQLFFLCCPLSPMQSQENKPSTKQQVNCKMIRFLSVSNAKLNLDRINNVDRVLNTLDTFLVNAN